MSIIKLSLSAIALSIPAVTFTAHAQTQAPMTNKEIDGLAPSLRTGCLT